MNKVVCKLACFLSLEFGQNADYHKAQDKDIEFQTRPRMPGFWLLQNFTYFWTFR